MKYSLLICLLFGTVLVWCQTQDIPFSMGIGGGLDYISNNDKNGSSLTYAGAGLPIGFNAIKKK